MSKSNIKVGSRVEFQNLVCHVVGRDGSGWIIQPISSKERITAMDSQLTLVLNEGHMDSERMEEYRNNLLCD